MEFINQILASIKTSTNPEYYYIALAAVLIFVFYIVNKIIKAVMFLVVISVALFGFSAMQGKDVNTVVASFITEANRIISEGKVQEFFSDLLVKFTGSTGDGLKKTVEDIQK
jgi:hypothetical protein